MTILVTGSSDGIGKATAHALLSRGHTVIIHGRRGEKLSNTAQELARIGSGAVHALDADLGSLKEVVALADTVAKRFPDLSALINNAGIMSRERKESCDGIELNFAVNHLAPLLLSLRLRSTLAKNAPSRIIFVSSMVHESGRIDLGDLEFTRNYEGMRAYSASKRANVYMTRVLAERFETEGITVNALHPGVIDTKLLHVYYAGGDTVDRGAQTSVYLATNEEVGSLTGRYFVNSREASTPALDARYGEEARALYERSIDKIGATIGAETVAG